MTDEMREYALSRTGAPPLVFRGELLAAAYGEDMLDSKQKKRNPRWHDLELFRTEGGRYVLYVSYLTEWGNEPDHDDVIVVESPADVVAVLRSWDPTTPVTGFPDSEPFKEKQEKLLREIRSRFAGVVSELFAQLGPEYAERIE